MPLFDIVTYFKNIAISHVDLAHTDENPAFFREYSSARVVFETSDFFKDQASHGEKIMILQSNDDGGTTGPHADSNLMNRNFAVWLLTKVEHNNFTEVDTAKAELQELFDDIYTKIRKDRNEETIPRQLNKNNIQLNSIGPIGDSYYGKVAFFSITNEEYLVSYNPEKWK